ncbi:MAG: hypothetical protein LC772_02765, partial [Chloroflexi bacterium]|nr:hypothetical protein [Chloroflexota bacterium]
MVECGTVGPEGCAAGETAGETGSETRDAACPACVGRGRSVQAITLKALLLPHALARLQRLRYQLCAAPYCPVVYFAPDSVFHKDDLEVRVGFKERDDGLPVCYCFGHTRASILDEIQQTGRSTAVQSITAHINAGRCGCEVNNPAGTCCLGEVNGAVRDARARLSPSAVEAAE